MVDLTDDHSSLPDLELMLDKLSERRSTINLPILELISLALLT
jgi:hypothetical protein